MLLLPKTGVPARVEKRSKTAPPRKLSYFMSAKHMRLWYNHFGSDVMILDWHVYALVLPMVFLAAIVDSIGGGGSIVTRS